jgi:hypothetical protein
MITSDTRNRLARRAGPSNFGPIRRDPVALIRLTGAMAHHRGNADRCSAVADGLMARRRSFA